MSTVCILTPIVIGSWPMITSAIAGAAAATGFAVAGAEKAPIAQTGRKKVEVEVPGSEVIAESLRRGEKVCIEREGVVIEFGVDERGALSMCVSGEGRSKQELESIGDEVVGRVVQQFAYHKLVTELKKRNYGVLEEHVEQDQSIQIRVRLGQ
jgi:hypothetical protein